MEGVEVKKRMNRFFLLSSMPRKPAEVKVKNVAIRQLNLPSNQNCVPRGIDFNEKGQISVYVNTYPEPLCAVNQKLTFDQATLSQVAEQQVAPICTECSKRVTLLKKVLVRGNVLVTVEICTDDQCSRERGSNRLGYRYRVAARKKDDLSEASILYKLASRKLLGLQPFFIKDNGSELLLYCADNHDLLLFSWNSLFVPSIKPRIIKVADYLAMQDRQSTILQSLVFEQNQLAFMTDQNQVLLPGAAKMVSLPKKKTLQYQW